MTFLSLISSTLYLWIFGDRSHEITSKKCHIYHVLVTFILFLVFFAENITLIQLRSGYLT